MNIELLWDVNDYYSLVVMVTLAIGALFQFPLLLVITGYLGILPASKLRKGRKLVFVIIIIVAALLTPGDVVVALVLLTIPLYGLFEGSIIMVAYVERGKARRQARVEERRKKREIDRDTAKQKAASALIKDKPAPAKDREGE
jgi:sec-independent protein translocase protein TatC